MCVSDWDVFDWDVVMLWLLVCEMLCLMCLDVCVCLKIVCVNDGW